MNQNPNAVVAVVTGIALYVTVLGAILYFGLRWSRRVLEAKASALYGALEAAGARQVSEGAYGGLYQGRERAYDHDGRAVQVGAWYVSRSHIRVNLRVPTAQRLPWVAIDPEGAVERFGKAIGLSREVQTGDAAFDDAAYVDTVEDDAAARRLLEPAAVRDAARALLAQGYRVQLSERGVEAYAVVGASAAVDASRAPTAVGLLWALAEALPSFEGVAVKGKAVARMTVPTAIAVWAWAPGAMLTVFFLAGAEGTLDTGPALRGAVAFGGACWLAYSLALALAVRGRSYALRVVLVGALLGLFGVLPAGGAGLVWLNQRLDTSPAEAHAATLLRLTYNRSDRYAYVLSWRPGRERERVPVSRAVYDRLRAGQTVTVRAHRGAFGWCWVEKVTGE